MFMFTIFSYYKISRWVQCPGWPHIWDWRVWALVVFLWLLQCAVEFCILTWFYSLSTSCHMDKYLQMVTAPQNECLAMFSFSLMNRYRSLKDSGGKEFYFKIKLVTITENRSYSLTRKRISTYNKLSSKIVSSVMFLGHTLVYVFTSHNTTNFWLSACSVLIHHDGV